MARNGAAFEFDAHEFLGRALSLLLHDGFLADKVLCVGLDKHAQPCHNRRDFCREFIAVERQTHLKAQRVAAAQSAGFQPSAFEEFVPSGADVGVRAVNLKPVLARVARAAHDERFAIVGYLFEGVEHEFLAVEAEHFANHCLCLRALHGELSVNAALVLNRHVVTGSVLLHPGKVFVDVCGVDDEEELFRAHLVNQQVVHRAAVGVEHHAVEDFANGRAGNVVGKDVLHVGLGIFARHEHFAHVAHVEHAAVLAHGVVLISDIGVIERHVEAAKFHHLGTCCQMAVVKTGSLRHIYKYCMG